MAAEAGPLLQLLGSAKEPQAILCCKRGGEALAAATDGTPPREGCPVGLTVSVAFSHASLGLLS